MKYLIMNGADVTAKNTVISQFNNKQDLLSRVMKVSQEGETPLMTASTNAAITFLLEHGSDREAVNNVSCVVCC